MTDAPTLRELEHAYARLVHETIPVLSSRRRPAIHGQLVVLDTEGRPALRYVPAPAPVGDPALVAETRGMVGEIVELLLQDLHREGRSGGSAGEIRDAISLIREKLAVDDIDPSVLTWALPARVQALEGSVTGPLLAAPLPDPWHVVPEYAARSGFDAAVTELLACTASLPVEELTPQTIEGVHLAVLPFCALGAARGLAVWHLLDADEVEEVAPQLGSGARETLGTLYSNSVLDVFTAWFMRSVGKLTALGGAGGAHVVEPAFRYLYPAREMRFHTRDPGEVGEGSVVLRFATEEVRRFLGVAAISWDLHVPTPHGDSRRDAYHDLLEVKLRDVTIEAASEMDRQYGRLLGVFGHHAGSLFKASGAFQLWSACARGETPEGPATKQVLDKLLPVWGISQAISLVQKQDEDGGPAVPRAWIDDRWRDRDDIEPEVVRAVLSVVRYVYENAEEGEPFLPWRVDGEPWSWSDDRSAWFSSLPPFADDPIIFDKTLAVTIGLFELAKNLRKYPPRMGWGRSVRKRLAKLPEADREVTVSIRTEPGVVHLDVEQPVQLQADGEIPRSRSLSRIRIFEYQCLRGLVATGELAHRRDTGVGRVARVGQTWTYRWGEVLRLHGEE